MVNRHKGKIEAKNESITTFNKPNKSLLHKKEYNAPKNTPKKITNKILILTLTIIKKQKNYRKLIHMVAKNKKVNHSYFSIYKEIPLILKARLLKKKNKNYIPTGKILIVNTCLIGDFIVSTPAIRKFIKKHPNKVDIIVSRPLKTLAEKIRGIRKVFVAESIYESEVEKIAARTRKENDKLDDYDTVIILRISKESYKLIKNVQTRTVKTSLTYYSKYGVHLLRKNIMKKTPKQWREVNFEILGEHCSNVAFDDIFAFTKADYDKIKSFEELNNKKRNEKIVIVHTHASFIMQQWDLNRWIELLQRIHKSGTYRFIFVGTVKENKDYKEILKKLDFKTYSLINKIDLKDLLLVMRKSDYFIGIDSGPRNMAHTADLRSVTILGPAPHLFMPPCPKDKILDKSNGRGLYQKFFYKKNGFINKITVDEVYDAFQKLVAESKKKKK